MEERKATVSGTVDEACASIKVNDVAASVRGERFTAEVPLLVGANVIIVAARDRAGNESAARAEVRRLDPAVGVVESLNSRWGIVIVRLAPNARAAVGERLNAIRDGQTVGALRVAKVMEAEPGAATGSISATPEGAPISSFRAGDQVRRTTE